MSTVRYFDNIPHIVRYGMHDDKTEKVWIWFWRCGVRFKVFVDGDDVKDTPFYAQWKPLLHEHKRGEMPLSQWVETQWHPLCDLIMSTAMPTLQRLAPDGEYWVTLRDLVHTPAYRLRLVASGGDGGSIETKVEEGPTQFGTGAYELAPVPRDTFSVPEGVRFFQSNELRVLDMDKDWRQRPKKVCSVVDGRMFSFVGCQQDVRHGGRDGPIVNQSIDNIRAKLEKMQTGTDDSEDVCGVVLDQLVLTSSAMVQGEERADDQEQRIMGILFPWLSEEDTPT